ncbi:MAG: polysaccharide deacetylase family protein [Clostridia bacterium]|nr:polysaccharide deacetylase family protein [Clostridia bacterium]
MNKSIWPNSAKCAFSFGWDLDGDTIWRNKVVKIPYGEKYIRSRSIGLYGIMKGAHRILDIMGKYNLRSTWFIPAENVERYPELIHDIMSCGHEIANHGLDHSDFYGNTIEKQLDNIRRSQDIFRRVIGKAAVGFRPTGPLLPDVEQILFEDNNTLYYSRGMAEEKIDFHLINGKRTSVVKLPCRQELDEYIQMVYSSYPQVLVGQPRIAPYEDVLSNFIREFEGAIRFGSAITSAFHPQVSGTPGKAEIIERLCEYIISNKDIWCTTCEEIATYWKRSMEEDTNVCK